jgi:spoIIIJ-associated protein
VSEVSVSVDEQAEVATDFTRGLVTAFGVDAKVDTRTEDEDVLIVDVTGDDLGLLVGPKGATLHAIAELVRTVVHVDPHPRTVARCGVSFNGRGVADGALRRLR